MKKKLSQVFIALGSNLENPVSQIRLAIEELKQLPSVNLIGQSSLYNSSPVEYLNQPDFINAVVLIETDLVPHDLLDALLEIERRHGRIRTFQNAPRTLDLDILLFDDLEFCDERLTVPHPRMSQRAFILKPMMEISPDHHIPSHGCIAFLLAACNKQRLEIISD